MSNDPNDKKVGGAHYNGTTIQPWDSAKHRNGSMIYYEISDLTNEGIPKPEWKQRLEQVLDSGRQ